MENTKEIIKPRRYNPRKKEIGYMVSFLYDEDYSWINEEGEYVIYLYAKVYYLYKYKFLGLTFNRRSFLGYYERNNKFKGKYSKIEYTKDKKLSNSDLIIKILKHYFKAGEIMTREEVNKFLYSNEFWNEVIFMENDYL